MGQYHYAFNLDKHEVLDPHKLGLGLKSCEHLGGHASMGDAVGMLITCSAGRGGGDLHVTPNVGRWAGDRIAIIGDYSAPDDIPGIDAEAIFNEYHESCDGGIQAILRSSDQMRFWKDITDEIVDELNLQFDAGIIKSSTGWRERV